VRAGAGFPLDLVDFAGAGAAARETAASLTVVQVIRVQGSETQYTISNGHD